MTISQDESVRRDNETPRPLPLSSRGHNEGKAHVLFKSMFTKGGRDKRDCTGIRLRDPLKHRTRRNSPAPIARQNLRTPVSNRGAGAPDLPSV